MTALRAIYHGGIRCDTMPVFIFNEDTGNFENEEVSYPFAIVMNDKDWQVYAVNDGLFYPIENKNRVNEENIHLLIKQRR